MPSLLASVLLLLAALPGTAMAAPGDERVRPGEWSKRKVPDGWVVVETDHYQVQSQVGEAKARRLADHLEAMLDVYGEILPFRKKLPTFVLKLFDGPASFHAYNPGARGAAAYYSKSQKELVAYDSGIILGERDIPARIRLVPGLDVVLTDAEVEELAALFERITDAYLLDLAGVLAHEGWPQYFHYYTVSWVPMPSWLDEGLGDYFYTAVQEQGAGSDYVLGAVNDYRLRVLQTAFEEGTFARFAELLEFEQADYYSNAQVYYAQGWSMVHFLMHHQDEKLRKLIPKLIKDFKDTKNFRRSTDKAFKGRDLDELEREWVGWVLSTEPDDPLRELAERFGTRLLAEDLEAPSYWRDRYETFALEVVLENRDEAGSPDRDHDGHR